MRLLPRRLVWCLVVSLLLHALAGIVAMPRALPHVASAIDVMLPQKVEPPVDKLLKNTLRDAEKNASVTPLATAVRGNRPNQTQEQQQLRLSAHVFYPPQAVEQGLEGEVKLLLRLDAKGRLLEARIAGSSGYEVLDNAAVAAAYATGVFAGGGRELVLPVVFRLSE